MIAPALRSAFQRATTWPIDHPRSVLVSACILAILASAAVSRLRRSDSLQDLLGDQSEAAAALQRVADRFAVVDELLVLVTDSYPSLQSTPEEASVRLLDFAKRFEAALAASPDTRAMCSRIAHGADAQMLDFVRSRVVPAGLHYLDDREFEALEQRLAPPAIKEQLRQNEAMIGAPGPAAGALAKQLLRDPLRLREFLSAKLGGAAGSLSRSPGAGADFISPDGRSLLIRIAGVRPAGDLEFCSRLTRQVRAIADQVRATEPGGTPPRVELSGAYAIAAISAASIRADAISNIVWDAVLMQALFLLMYRRYSSFLLTMVPVCLGVLVSFAVYALLGRRLNPLTAVIAAMLAGLAADYCIHYLSHYDSVRPHSAGVRDAARRTIADIGLPLFATGITTVHGFLAIAFSGARALRDFALLGAIGLLCALIASVVLLPALLRIAEGAATTFRRSASPGSARFAPGFLVNVISRHPRLSASLAAACLIAMTLTCLLGRAPSLETDLSVMHPRPNAPLETQRRIVELFGGVADPLLIDFTAASPGELVAKAHAIHSALHSPEAAAAGITATLGLASLLPDPSALALRAARNARLDPDKIASNFDAAVRDSLFDPAAYRDYSNFLRALASPPPAPGLDALRLFPSVSVNFLASKDPASAAAGAPPAPPEAITYIFLNHPLERRDLRDRSIEAIRRLLAPIPGATLTGIAVVSLDVERMIRRDIPRVLVVSIGAVLLTVVVLFRRPMDILLIFVPVAWSVAAVLTFMTLTDERINMANLVAMPLLMGICVDYGIFAVGLARAAKAERLAGGDTGDTALSHRLAASGHAMLITTVTTLIGFGTLVTTGTPAIQSLGRLTAVGIAACFLGTLFLLQPILILLHRRLPSPSVPSTTAELRSPR